MVNAEAGADALSCLFGSLGTMTSRLFVALDGLDLGGLEEQRALAALGALYDDLRRDEAMVTQDWLRPWRKYGRGAAVVTQAMRAAMDSFIDAYAAPDVGPAQRFAQQGQEHLDRAASLAASLAAELEFAQASLDLDEADLLSTCIARELERLGSPEGGTQALLALDEAGRRRLPVLAGPGEPGLGLQVQLVLLPAAVLLDPDQLAAVCEDALGSLGVPPMRALGQDADWLARQHAATTTLLDACRILADLASVAQFPPRRGVRAQLLFIQDLVEGPVRHLLATFLACTGGDEQAVAAYAAARGGSGGSAVAAARKTLPPSLTEAVHVPARHASAHADFFVDGDRVTLQPSKGVGGVTMSHGELTDAVLGALETSLALQLALLAACERAEVVIDETALLDELDPQLLPRVLLAAAGWRDVQVTQSGTALLVTGISDIATPIPIFGMLLARLDTAIERVQLVVKGPGGTRTFSTPCAPFRAYAARPQTDNDLEALLAFTDALAQVTSDGEPVVTKATLRHTAAMLVGQEINGDIAAATARLQRLRRWAAGYDDDVLDAALRNTHRGLSALRAGLPVNAAEQEAIDLVARWEREPAPLPDRW